MTRQRLRSRLLMTAVAVVALVFSGSAWAGHDHGGPSWGGRAGGPGWHGFAGGYGGRVGGWPPGRYPSGWAGDGRRLAPFDPARHGARAWPRVSGRAGVAGDAPWDWRRAWNRTDAELGWHRGAWAWDSLWVGASLGVIVAPPLIVLPPPIYVAPPPIIVGLPAIGPVPLAPAEAPRVAVAATVPPPTAGALIAAAAAPPIVILPSPAEVAAAAPPPPVIAPSGDGLAIAPPELAFAPTDAGWWSGGYISGEFVAVAARPTVLHRARSPAPAFAGAYVYGSPPPPPVWGWAAPPPWIFGWHEARWGWGGGGWHGHWR